MGLGKTFVASEKMKTLNSDLNIIVCQKSKIDDWINHIKTYYPDYAVSKYKDLTQFNQKKSVIIINYDLVWRKSEFKKLKDFTLILDESSYIKNSKSKRTKFILSLKPENVILLSGTPIGGKYEEIYTQLKLLGWNITKKEFYERYIITTSKNIGGFKIEFVIGYKNIDDLKCKLNEYGAIFMKTEDVLTLPPKIEMPISIKNTRQYSTFKKDRLVIVDDVEILGETTLTKLLGLRQLASIYNKYKHEKVKELLESTEDRLIIFYNFTAEYELLKATCEKLNKPVSTINGTLTDLENYRNFKNSVTIVQYQAGSMGINLQKSNKIIYYSLPLSSDLFEQSKKRTHRIGQNKTCYYYYLIVEKSIEEQIYTTLLKRSDFTNKLFEKLEG